jgi:hypothetical protein
MNFQMTPVLERGVSFVAGLIWSGFWVAVVKNSNALENTHSNNADWFLTRQLANFST